MRQKATYIISNMDSFKTKLLIWSSQFQQSAFLNGQTDLSYGCYLKYDLLLGVESLSEISPKNNSFDKLKEYHDLHKDWLFGYLSYDLKNEIEDLSSDNDDYLHFPKLYFFQPKWVFEIQKNRLIIHFPITVTRKEMQLLFNDIMKTELNIQKNNRIQINKRTSKENYYYHFEELKNHILRGDIYEVNYCHEYYATSATINPIQVYLNLQKLSSAPFSTFFKSYHHFILSSSPERFLKKISNKLVSQPIKGTRKRGLEPFQDEELKNDLKNCPKEQSENVMIVDLVRNDLSRTAQVNSVKVEELFGIYSFPQVHQMISTVTSEMKNDIHWIEALKTTFPMGSMTGAPKIRAMQLIEEHESFKRGLYSGSVGYITPHGDFDFNVVIRSILYNSNTNYLSFSVGSAITANANADDEYAECQLKAKAMLEVLNA